MLELLESRLLLSEVPFAAQELISTAAELASSVLAAGADGDRDLSVRSGPYSGADNGTSEWRPGMPIDLFSTEHVISTAADLPSAVFAADVDGDGDLDVISGSGYDGKIAWYENTDGNATFGPQRVISTAAAGARSVVAADLDGDGDLDVLSASYYDRDDKIAWYENVDGSGTFGAQQVITTAVDIASSVFAADVDGDGDLDVLSASYSNDQIAWYENTDANGSFGPKQIISTDLIGPLTVFAADLDGDGDLDVISGSYYRYDNKVTWYENTDGSGTFGPEQVISTEADQTFSVFAVDVDGDGDVDVLSASYFDDTIAWYENTDGNGTFGPQRVITTEAVGATSVFAADMDGDRDVDVLSGSFYDDKIAWYQNMDAKGTFGQQKVISDAADGARAVFAADLDGDGDVDVLSASQRDDKIAWYESEGVTVVAPIVTKVNSTVDTGDGQLRGGELTNATITQLLVTFSKDVVDGTSPNGAENLGNYSLVADPDASKTPVTIDSVSYNPAIQIATVSINGGLPLSSNRYRLRVVGTTSITDAAGNKLDGNGDGIGGDDFVLNFEVDRTPPVLTLVSPAPSSTISEDPGFVELQISDGDGAGLDPATIGTDDVAITGVIVDGAVQLGGGLFRYTYSGVVPSGTVEVATLAGALADVVGNTVGASVIGTFSRLLPGDADGDADVDFADFTILNANFTGTITPPAPPGAGGKTHQEGDFDGDGDIDFRDFVILAGNFTGTRTMRRATNEPALALSSVPRLSSDAAISPRPEPAGQAKVNGLINIIQDMTAQPEHGKAYRKPSSINRLRELIDGASNEVDLLARLSNSPTSLLGLSLQRPRLLRSIAV